MSEKSIIIVGAGVAGLAAGCYGQMNGYNTQIYEQHFLPGGICTSWERQGYIIDGALRWVLGCSPQSGVHRLWQELGAVKGRHYIYPDEVLRFEGANGKVFRLYSNIDHLNQHMNELAPEDQSAIAEWIQGLRDCLALEMSLEPLTASKIDTTDAASLNALKKWSALSVRQLAGRFHNPLLQEGLQQVVPPDFPAVVLMTTIGMLARRAAGYPVGGSLEFARAIERRYLELGGKIQYSARVARILVENDRAVGVQLEDGSEHRADHILSAADGHATIFNLLGGRYLDDAIRGFYRDLPTFAGLLHIAFGVNRTFTELPVIAKGLVLELPKPVMLAGRQYRHLPVSIYNFDNTLAPPDRTVIKVMLESDYDYWDSISKDVHRYNAEKEYLADQIIALLEQRFPGLADQVEMRDVATPVSFERYTGNWQGSYQGWLITNRTLGLRMPKTLPGLENFWMIGQWVEPGGGLPASARSGRQVIQELCQRDGRVFQTRID